MNTVIYWVTKDQEIIKWIKDRFNISSYTSVNGESPANIKDEDWELLKECEKKGKIQIRNKNK